MDFRWRSVSLLAGLPMLIGVAACGGGGSKDAVAPAPTPTAIATAEPSSTPEPTGSATATSSTRPSATGSPTAIPAGMVRITFLAANCEGCRFTAVDTTARPKPVTYPGTYVYNGKATVLVPINLTRDMAFRADYSERMGIGGARPDLVLGYQGVADSTEVEWETAQAKEQGNYCWAGTTTSEVTIHVLHKIFNDPKDKQTPTGIAFWASPTLPVDVDRYRAADHGGLGDQDFPYCTHD